MAAIHRSLVGIGVHCVRSARGCCGSGGDRPRHSCGSWHRSCEGLRRPAARETDGASARWPGLWYPPRSRRVAPRAPSPARRSLRRSRAERPHRVFRRTDLDTDWYRSRASTPQRWIDRTLRFKRSINVAVADPAAGDRPEITPSSRLAREVKAAGQRFVRDLVEALGFARSALAQCSIHLRGDVPDRVLRAPRVVAAGTGCKQRLADRVPVAKPGPDGARVSVSVATGTWGGGGDRYERPRARRRGARAAIGARGSPPYPARRMPVRLQTSHTSP